MMKKVAIVALGVAAAMTVLSFTRVGSYSGTCWSKICNNASRQVPLEFEIERLKHEVAQLVPDLKKNLSQVAQEIASVEKLRDEVTTIRANLDKQKAAMLKLTHDMDSGETSFVQNGREYTRAQVATKLERDLEAFKRAEAELVAKEKLLAAKEKSVDAAKAQLASIKDQKTELEIQIAQLEAELKDVRVTQTKTKFVLDDSRLSNIKRSLADLRSRVRAEQIQNDLEGQFGDVGTPVADKPVRPAGDVSKTVREYLEGPKVADQK